MLRKLRNTVLCIMIAMNILDVTRMRVDQIEELMAAMKHPKIAHTLREEDLNGDG